MSIANTAFKSRWGFHPCNYALFLKLRRLHKWYWETVYDFHRWHRWWRKQEQNRVGPEPPYCGVFVQDKTWIKSVLVHGEAGFKLYPKTVIDHGIVALYQTARMPQPEATAVAACDAETVERIELLYDRVRAHFKE